MNVERTIMSDSRSKREKNTIKAMTKIFCHDIHGRNEICAECRDFLAYAHARLDKCPHQAAKPTCANCKTHCYKPEMRQQALDIMRYAGPRMLTKHPYLALRHVLNGWRKS